MTLFLKVRGNFAAASLPRSPSNRCRIVSFHSVHNSNPYRCVTPVAKMLSYKFPPWTPFIITYRFHCFDPTGRARVMPFPNRLPISPKIFCTAVGRFPKPCLIYTISPGEQLPAHDPAARVNALRPRVPPVLSL